mgnify:FL=1|tara:strand:+ start:95 stop:2098 length:2004 start_codon:yes stop_codon:yes gene_type:complete
MAKVNVDVLLKDGTDETAFINDVTSNSEVDLVNRLPNSPTLLVLDVEESYFDTLRSHSSVVNVEVEERIESSVTYPSRPSKYTLSNKSIGGSTYWTNWDGTKAMSYQHYLDTDIIPSPSPDRTVGSYTGNKVGCHYYWGVGGTSAPGQRDQIRHYGSQPNSDHGQYPEGGPDNDYWTYYTGKGVDIVTIEGGSSANDNMDTAYAGWHDHVDFDDPDNPGTSRVIPMNWPGTSTAANSQVSTDIALNSHGTGVLSAAAGLNCGFAKKAQLRAMYLTNAGDYITVCLDALKGWHNAKSNGRPTVVTLEWHHPPLEKEKAIKVEDIDSVTDPDGGTTNRPSGGWGSDLTPFVDRLIIPFQLKDPNDNSWHWVIPFQRQDQASYHVAIEQCWDAGIVVVNAGGNGGGITVNDNDPRWNGTYCTISGTKTLYSMNYGDAPNNGQNDPCKITKGTTSTANWYPLKCYGPSGVEKSITVAAGENSEGSPSLNMYSGRGPAVDIIGRGNITWTAGTPTGSLLTDGNRWGLFGGTSCAMPTVAGKAACYMEKHYTLHGSWPTPDQVKNAMIAESKPTSMSVNTINWSNVPTASDTDVDPPQQSSDAPCLKIKSGTGGTAPNGGWRYGEHVGTPNRQAFWNAQDFNREHTYGKRPTSGVMYPRPRKFNIPQQEENGY